MSAAKEKPPAYRGTRLSAAERQRMIVDAALRAVAEQGFEGFRTRDVAASIGINSATLHHHFPTKEDLVAAVAGELTRRFTDKPEPAGTSSPLADFRWQFDDAASYIAEQPELLAVYRELVARAVRDPFVADLVAGLNTAWRQDVRSILQRAKDDGILRDGIDIDVAARLVVSAIWDAAIVSQDRSELNAMHRQLERLLLLRA